MKKKYIQPSCLKIKSEPESHLLETSGKVPVGDQINEAGSGDFELTTTQKPTDEDGWEADSKFHHNWNSWDE